MNERLPQKRPANGQAGTNKTQPSGEMEVDQENEWEDEGSDAEVSEGVEGLKVTAQDGTEPKTLDVRPVHHSESYAELHNNTTS